jgi:hypothetical protein
MNYFIVIIFIASLLLFCRVTIQFLPDQVQRLDVKRTSEEAIDNFLIHHLNTLQISGLSIAIIENDKIIYYKALEKTLTNEINLCKRTELQTRLPE